MEGQCGHENPLQLVTLAFGGNANDVFHTCQDNPNQQNFMAARRIQMAPVSPPLPHRSYNKQISHRSYIQCLAESDASEIQRKISYNNLRVASGSKPAYSSIGINVQKEVKYLRPHNEAGPMNDFTGAEYQIHIQKQESKEPHSRVAVAAPKFSPKPRNHVSRRKASDTDRSRRLRIAERVDALKELLPHPTEGGKASVLDDIIDHIKYLQLQVKELSQSRLGGELTSDPFVFLEGYGHYLLHDQMLNEPLEEMMGKLLEVNPSAAAQLLGSRGLVMAPTALAEGLHQA